MLTSSAAIFFSPLQHLPCNRMFPPQPIISCVRSCNSNRTCASYSSSSTAGRRPSTLYSSPKLASSSSLYDVLGLSAGATSQEIKTAYRKLARSCHPDVVAMDRKDTSADEFMKIHAAYSTLSDPAKRADYDRTLVMARAWQSQAATSRFSSTRRTWETDQCW